MSADRQVIDKFTARALGAIDNFSELLLAVHNKRNQRSLESLLVQQLVMSVAVSWEAFINDLMLTYVASDSKTCIKLLKSKVGKSMADRFGADVAKCLRFSFPKSLSKSRAASLIDPKGWNITTASAATLSSRANDLLSAQHAKRFSLNADDGRFLDFVICLRNYLSHRSNASFQALKSSITQLGTTDAFLASRLTEIGAYLKCKDSAGTMRGVVIIQRLVQIAGRL